MPAPLVGIILGSGLGRLVDEVEILSAIDYSEIPDFPRSTVEGHKGRFVYGRLGDRPVIIMEGRVHFYEGYSIEDVVFPVRVLCCLGIETLIVSNAAGGVNPIFRAGDIMVIDDQINRIPNPLIGPNIDELGLRFPDMTRPYDPELITLAHGVAAGLGLTLRQGCYIGTTGPAYETPAEYRYFRVIGADATGMSTTPEVIVARHQGVRVLGLSLISNVGLGHVGSVTHEEVMEAGIEASGRMSGLVTALVAKL